MAETSMIFFQQHYYTFDFFKKYYKKWNEVPTTETPHYLFCQGDESRYREYLANSWRHPRLKKELDEIEEKISTFRNLKDSIENEGCIEPVEIVIDEKGRELLVHGNHRAAICETLQIPLKKNIVSMEERINKLCYNEEDRYGTSTYGVPYQPVINKKGEIIKQGRREDLVDRHEIILDWIDFTDLAVGDFGSNLGAAGNLCLNSGARLIFNIEKSERIISSSIRLAVLLDNTNIIFKNRNLSEDHVKLEEKIDVAFSFSIHKHVNNNELLSHSIADNIKYGGKFVFETHSRNEQIPIEFLEKFRILDFSNKLNNRDLYLLERK